jgi:dephospho-CoA kinase
MIAIGLTGCLSSGKSTVLEMFCGQGAKALSCDVIVAQEFERNRALRKRIGQLFGASFIEGGVVKRSLLANKIFVSAHSLKKLNALVHPLVKKRILQFLKKYKKDKKTIAVVEVPLLFETGFDKLFDWTVVVTATPSVLKGRSRFSPAQWRRRMQWQDSLPSKIARCDFIIDNNGLKTKTERQVRNLMRFLTRSAEDSRKKSF